MWFSARCIEKINKELCVCVRACVRACVCTYVNIRNKCLEHSLEYTFFICGLVAKLLVSCNNLQGSEIFL